MHFILIYVNFSFHLLRKLYHHRYFITGGSIGKCLGCCGDLEEDIPEDTFPCSSEGISNYRSMHGTYHPTFVCWKHFAAVHLHWEICKQIKPMGKKQRWNRHLLYFSHVVHYDCDVCRTMVVLVSTNLSDTASSMFDRDPNSLAVFCCLQRTFGQRV